MKLCLLHEADADLVSKIVQAMGRAMFKKRQDPNSPEQPGKDPMLPYRTGSQDTPLKPRHRRFFNSPSSGKDSKGGYRVHGAPLGAERPDRAAHKPAPAGMGSWGKRPGVADI